MFGMGKEKIQDSWVLYRPLGGERGLVESPDAWVLSLLWVGAGGPDAWVVLSARAALDGGGDHTVCLRSLPAPASLGPQ